MNTEAIRDALATLVREGVGNLEVLAGIAWELSRQGLHRHQIMNFFWYLQSCEGLEASHIEMIGDFADLLHGACKPEETLRLFGDPEDPMACSRLAQSDNLSWKRPDEH